MMHQRFWLGLFFRRRDSQKTAQKCVAFACETRTPSSELREAERFPSDQVVLSAEQPRQNFQSTVETEASC
jgi:hypothetical protein